MVNAASEMSDPRVEVGPLYNMVFPESVQRRVLVVLVNAASEMSGLRVDLRAYFLR